MTEALVRQCFILRNDSGHPSFSGIPSGFETFSVALSGGVATLNHRLIAAVPPGQGQLESNTDIEQKATKLTKKELDRAGCLYSMRQLQVGSVFYFVFPLR